jgi:hypothetical protein
MKIKSLITISATVSFLLINSWLARAQSEPPKIELGGHFSQIRFTDIRSIQPLGIRVVNNPPPVTTADVTNSGFGIRAGYNISRFLTFEAELNYFPAAKKDFEKGGRKLQGVVGAKAGLRKERFGIFGKFRPGFMRFSALIDCGDLPDDPNTPHDIFVGCGIPPKTYSTVDLGGVLELYPSRRSLVRFDLGNTRVYYQHRNVVQRIPDNDFNGITVDEGMARNHLQFSIGIGFRF